MKLIVISNMYPDKKHPSYGIFIKRICDQLSFIGVDYKLSTMHRADFKVDKVFKYLKFYVCTILRLLYERYDAVYVHYPSYSGIPVLIANRFRKKPVIVNVHGTDVMPVTKEQIRMESYTKKIIEICEFVIVPSKYFEQCVHKKYKVPYEKIKIYPSGGIDPKLFFRRNLDQINDLRKRYNINETLPTFGLACRIAQGKGWDIYIKAISQLVKQGIKANFIFVGEGPQKAQFDALMETYNLASKIKIYGLMSQNELSEFYSLLDFFVFPTEGESLGLVALEAMACGTPVIASDCSALRYYITDGRNGYKFEQGNITELCHLMKDICINYHKIPFEQLKEGAICTAETYFENNIIEELRILFR